MQAGEMELFFKIFLSSVFFIYIYIYLFIMYFLMFSAIVSSTFYR